MATERTYLTDTEVSHLRAIRPSFSGRKLVEFVDRIVGGHVARADVAGSLLSEVAAKSLSVSVEHNPHAAVYETVEQYLEHRDPDVTADVRAEMVARGEVWEVQCYPDTPVGFLLAVHYSLEDALRQMRDWLTQEGR